MWVHQGKRVTNSLHTSGVQELCLEGGLEDLQLNNVKVRRGKFRLDHGKFSYGIDLFLMGEWVEAPSLEVFKSWVDIVLRDLV